MYRVLGIDNEVALRYCEIYLQLKNLVELISDTDLLIAVVAMKYDHTLVIKDRDFQHLTKYDLKLGLREWTYHLFLDAYLHYSVRHLPRTDILRRDMPIQIFFTTSSSNIISWFNLKKY